MKTEDLNSFVENIVNAMKSREIAKTNTVSGSSTLSVLSPSSEQVCVEIDGRAEIPVQV